MEEEIIKILTKYHHFSEKKYYFELVQSWNIPANTNLCSSWAICNPQEITLHPGGVNEINTPFEGNSPKHIRPVQNQMNAKHGKLLMHTSTSMKELS